MIFQPHGFYSLTLYIDHLSLNYMTGTNDPQINMVLFLAQDTCALCIIWGKLCVFDQWPSSYLGRTGQCQEKEGGRIALKLVLGIGTWLGFPRWQNGEESSCQCRGSKRCKFDPWVGKTPWSRKWQPTPLFLHGESHGQRSLVGYSPWSHKSGTQLTQLF